jgi:hypothetical protein
LGGQDLVFYPPAGLISRYKTWLNIRNHNRKSHF